MVFKSNSLHSKVLGFIIVSATLIKYFKKQLASLFVSPSHFFEFFPKLHLSSQILANLPNLPNISTNHSQTEKKDKMYGS